MKSSPLFVMVVNITTREPTNELTGSMVRFARFEIAVRDGPVVSPYIEPINGDDSRQRMLLDPSLDGLKR
jgi:hypothetical protein